MPDKKEKRPWPGDPGYKGGTFNTTVFIDGKAKNVRTIKDADGNILFTSITDSFLGIF